MASHGALGVLRSGRRYLPAVLAVVAAGSFSLTLPFSGWSPSAAFYLLPARGWELALGALLAALRADRVPARFARWASAGAMAALLRDAIRPNLVQTIEETPALVHAAYHSPDLGRGVAGDGAAAR